MHQDDASLRASEHLAVPPPLLRPYCSVVYSVMVGKLLDLSESQVTPLKNGKNDRTGGAVGR